MGRPLTRWLTATGAVAGQSHELSGMPCQDAVGSQHGIVTAMALADGTGSASHSEIGARIAVDAVLQLLLQEFDTLASGDAETSRSRVIDEVTSAQRRHVDERVAFEDLACTLLFVAVRENTFMAGHLGDGVITYARNDSALVLSRPQRGEHANETTFVTSRNARSSLALFRGSLEEISAFGLMSDGSAESLYLRVANTIASGVTSMWNWLEENSPAAVELALEDNLRNVVRNGTADDCSLALMRRVTLTADDLRARDMSFQQAFLDCGTAKGVQTRLSVLSALEISSGHRDWAAKVAAETALSLSTVRKHAAYLRNLMRVPQPEHSRPLSMPTMR